MAEIRIKNVAETFGAYPALRSIDLTVADQEFMVLLGAAGCGKTTLLRIVARPETATQGEGWIGNRRVDGLAPRECGIAATAKVVEPLGAHLLVTCDVDSAQFRAVLDSGLVLRPGDRLTLAPWSERKGNDDGRHPV